MHTQTKSENIVTDLDAVREFLLSGREIPRETRATRPHHKAVAAVPVHNGIVRARTRSVSRA